MARADQGMGAGATGQQGGKGAGSADPDTLSENDLASDIKGNNQLQADDALNVQDERHAQAMSTQETSGIVENARRQDPDYRAQAELGKGNRYPDEHDHNANAATGEEGSAPVDPASATHNAPADTHHDAWEARGESGDTRGPGLGGLRDALDAKDAGKSDAEGSDKGNDKDAA